MTRDWPVISSFEGVHLRRLAMPLGGIGTGFFALGGRGELTDWQLMSRPLRGWRPMYSHIVVRGKVEGQPAVLRIAERDLEDGLADDFGAPAVLAGVPRFRDAAFHAAYPFGEVRLKDTSTPFEVSVEAFNPLIPHQTDDSSLPVALLTVSVTSTASKPMDASVTLLLTNFVGTDGKARDLKDNVTERAAAAGWNGMSFAKTRPDRTAQNGTMAVLTDAPGAVVARRWKFRDRPWNGEQLGIIDSLLTHGVIEDDEPEKSCPPSPDDTWDSSLSVPFQLAAGQTKSVRILITWHFPWRNLKDEGWWSGTGEADPVVGNYYATQYSSALDVAAKTAPRLASLRAQTAEFVRSVAESKAPHALKEAALFNLTPLRTHTSFRLSDGTFAAYEGCGGDSGCCTGSCTHVWNYEEATHRLFPDLHRSMIESHLAHCVTPTGAERFRLTLPVKNQTWGAAAADGQMGLIVRCYQQVLAEGTQGGKAWLTKWYPAIRKMMEFCWIPGGWDADRDGVMEGSQHNTYDVEFFGPNPLGTVWYLAALAAMSRMAEINGDPAFQAVCDDLRKRGSAWMDSNLYNGRYYRQQIVPPGSVGEFTALTGEPSNPHPRFQVGNGCLIDQLCGQYKANRAGLGNLLDEMHIRTTLKHIYQYNYHHNFREHYNNMRTFAQGDESGTIICSWPDGDRLEVPLSYWSECMTGFEYQFAVLLLDYGFKAEGERVAAAVRGRHNGANRNPFNEPECGSYYARSMAAWALLDAWKTPAVTM